MAKFVLSCGQVVKLRNEKIGIVTCFNGKPSHVIMASFSNPITKWDDDLKHSNTNYDIVEVRDGSKVENPLDAFKKRTFNDLDVLYKREE